MSKDRGALPGTARTATIQLHISEMAAGARAFVTVSLENVSFNEVEAPARFALFQVRCARADGLWILPTACADAIEAEPRWSIASEVSVEVVNKGAAITNLTVVLMLIGFPPAPIPGDDFERVPALAVADKGGAFTATDKLGVPIECDWTL